MLLRYIFGPPGSGKSTLCINEIVALENDSDKFGILIVPEQFSLQSERAIIKKSKRSVMMNMQVLSFKRLAFMIFSEAGTFNKILGNVGKSIIIRKILNEVCDELSVYKKSVNKQGFIKNLILLFAEFFQYDMNPQDIKQIDLPNQNLNMKLEDIMLIYERYSNYLKENYIIDDEVLSVLSEKIGFSKMLSQSSIWIDGFYSFTPQEYKVISQLIMHAKEVNISFNTYEQKISYPNLTFDDPWFEVKSAINQITAFAKMQSIPIKTFCLEESVRFKKCDDIEFLAENYFNCCLPKHNNVPQNISLYHADDIYSEVIGVAEKICAMVTQKQFQYNQIAIIVGDIERYKIPIRIIFREYNLPIFIDENLSLFSNRLTEFIRSLLQIVISNMSYESVFRFLKTGLLPISQEEIDLLENFVLERGVRGKQWFNNFTGSAELNMVMLNDIRERCVKFWLPLYDYVRDFSDRCSVQCISKIIFELIINFGVLEKLQQTDDKVVNQVWKKICEMFDKIVEILGDELISIEDFASVIDAGIEQIDLGIIPPSQNQITVGNIERSRLPEVKALFIMGANEGIFPAPNSSDSLLSDDERVLLNAGGIELAPSIGKKVFRNNFLLYSTLCKASEVLSLSCSLRDSNGKEMFESRIFKVIRNIFPDIVINSYEVQAKESVFGLGRCLKNLAMSSDNNALQDLKLSSECVERFENIKRLLSLHSVDEDFIVKTNENSKAFLSISHLEEYAKCSYYYFLKYLLRLTERKVYGIQKVDTGIFLHSVLKKFMDQLQLSNINWNDLSPQKIETLVENSVADFVRETPIFFDNNYYKYCLAKLTAITKKSLWAIGNHTELSNFIPDAAELEFKNFTLLTENNCEIVLSGKIDRVDLSSHNKNLFCIVDYKSGNKKFDKNEVYHGLQLQLMAYAKIFSQISGKTPAGCFYFHLDDPLTDYNGLLSDEQLNQKVLDGFKLSGITVNGDQFKNIIVNSGKCEQPEFDLLNSYVDQNIKKLGDSILNGDISINPYKKKNFKACDYCQFSSVCKIQLLNKNCFRNI